MEELRIGVSVPRKGAWDKVTGNVKYNDDFTEAGLLHARLVISSHAHAKINNIDISQAISMPGVLAVVTGDCYDANCGQTLEDRPPIARGKVRYYGEPVAIVVAHTEYQAEAAMQKVRVDYELLPVVNTIDEALKPGAPLVHEELSQYRKIIPEVYPEPGTNIATRLQVRKGDLPQGWSESEVVVEEDVKLPQCDHAAMETRNARAEIKSDGRVIIHTSSQGPFIIKKMLSRFFHIEVGKITVHTPLVGGAFGGKTTQQLEIMAYLASKAVGGRMVRVANPREEDIISSPVHIGMSAHIKLGAAKDGALKAAEIFYAVECGAYSDSGPNMCRAIAANGTGPYHIENLHSEVVCVYTNHTFVTAFRGFGHLSYTFLIERALDKLAFALDMDPIELRLKNALTPGQYSPTQVKLTQSNLGDLPQCIRRVGQLINWDEGLRTDLGNGKIRAKGFSSFWKTSSSPVNAVSGAILAMNADGTINLNCGVVECGQGTKTALAQILAEKMRMDADQIHVKMDVDSESSPDHWKTVASMSLYMAGRAVLEAAEDIIRQLKSIASIVMRCSPEVLEVGGGRIYHQSDPEQYVEIQEVAHGYQYANGNSIGGQIIGKGSFIMPQLTSMDRETGKGKTGPAWTVGAQAVEVELDTSDFSYKLIKAVTVADAGKVINPMAARGEIMGAMKMGLGYGSREVLSYDQDGAPLNSSFRSYKTIRLGEQPQYLVDFVETPDQEAPYGERGLGEEGILGMPAALANALSSAAQTDLNQLPLTPETIWKTVKGKAT